MHSENNAIVVMHLEIDWKYMECISIQPLWINAQQEEISY